MFSSDLVVSAGAHSLGEFEPELARVGAFCVSFQSGLIEGGTQLMHQYTTAPPADPLKQARTDMDNV